MKKKLLFACLVMVALGCVGCGPTLQDTKVQYVMSVNSARVTLDALQVLKDTNQLTPSQISSVSTGINQFDFYRAKVRAAIDANQPAPATDLVNLKGVLDTLILIEIEKEGVK